MTKRKAVLYVTLFMTVVVLWCFMHSERMQIKRVFADMERLAAKEPGESMMECAAKSRALARHFKDGCAIIDLCHGLKASYSREDIAGGLMAFRSRATKIAVVFHELEISVEGGEARVAGWIDYSGTEASWPGYEPKPAKFLAHLEKIDGQWLISRIKVP